MINTTKITVFIDGDKPASPFPIIGTNGTHYFIYFEFTLSTHTITIQFAPITAMLDIDPDTLDLQDNGQWITAYIELTEGYDVNEICVSTIKLNDIIAVDPAAPTTIGDYDNDGVPDLMVKFDRAAVQQYILGNAPTETRFRTTTLTLTWELNNGTQFRGSDTIKIIFPKNYWKIMYLEEFGIA
jgi:hypothetical protein